VIRCLFDLGIRDGKSVSEIPGLTPRIPVLNVRYKNDDHAGASNRKEPNPVYASAQKFVDSLKKSAVKTEPMPHPDRVQRVNMESLLGKKFFFVLHIPLLFLLRYFGSFYWLFSTFFSYRYRFQNLYWCSVLRIRCLFEGRIRDRFFSRSEVPDPQPIFLRA
jgi:hypothetical protein